MNLGFGVGVAAAEGASAGSRGFSADGVLIPERSLMLRVFGGLDGMGVCWKSILGERALAWVFFRLRPNNFFNPCQLLIDSNQLR